MTTFGALGDTMAQMAMAVCNLVVSIFKLIPF